MPPLYLNSDSTTRTSYWIIGSSFHFLAKINFSRQTVLDIDDYMQVENYKHCTEDFIKIIDSGVALTLNAAHNFV